MLGETSSSAIVGVSDIDRSRRFYRDMLGLELLADADGPVIVFRTGATRLVVYASNEAGGNRANAVVWDAGADFGAIVAALQARGVVFEHYPDMEGVTLEGDVHAAGSLRMVWFKDPDGNILHVNTMSPEAG